MCCELVAPFLPDEKFQTQAISRVTLCTDMFFYFRKYGALSGNILKIEPLSFDADYNCTPNDPHEVAIKAFITNADREMTFLAFLQTLLPAVAARGNDPEVPELARIEYVTGAQWTGIARSFLNIVKWFAPRVQGLQVTMPVNSPRYTPLVM